MASYAKVVDGKLIQWPYGVGQLRQDNSGVSFPSDVLSDATLRQRFDVVVVKPAEGNPPAGYKAVQVGPVFEGGEWTEKYDNVLKEEAELLEHDFTNPNPPSDDILKDEHGVFIKTHEYSGNRKVGNTWEKIWTTQELTYEQKRQNAYGPPVDQLEYIVENGLDAWISRANEIKGWYPKS